MIDRSPDPAERAARSPLRHRSFLGGAFAAGTAGAALGHPAAGKATADGAFPFHGLHQAGIDRPAPARAQPVASFFAFDVTVADRRDLVALFRVLTERARFLTSGGVLSKGVPGPRDDGLLGGTVVPGGLTVTAGVGASLFDGRYGLAARKPVQLKTMQPFDHDDLNPAECHGDLLLQLCAGHRDVLVRAFLDILAHTGDALRPRWHADAFLNPPRPNGTPRDMPGFKDGIAGPDTGTMNQQVWIQPHTAEPAWTAGGTYQAVRVVRFFAEKWSKVPVDEQERITPYGTEEVYTNDPQGSITPLDTHIRLASPSTSSILRRGYQYARTPDPAGRMNVGHVFCYFQPELNTYIDMQNRLENEPPADYLSPTGGGYFFVLPGVRDSHDYYARGLLASLGSDQPR
jgi:deferrochelatase/peroxidase EfeB